MFLWIADHTGIEDVLGTVAEPGHGQCRTAVPAGSEQRLARLVHGCGSSRQTRQYVLLNCLAKKKDKKLI